ncbi:MAG: ATP-binding protein [Fuerstiella sp.]
MLKNLSLNTKLVSLTSLAVLLGLIVSCTAFWWNNSRTISNAKVTQLYSVGKTLAFNCTGVLMFQDADAATELLSALGADDSIEHARLANTEGDEFATFGAQPAGSEVHEMQIGSSVFTDSGFLVVNVPIYDSGADDELMGTLTLTANTADLAEHFWNHMLIVSSTVVLALAASMFPLILVYREIVQPILTLADTAKSISIKEDYSIRLERDSADEIGVMYGAFNGLLDQVQQSESQVKQVQLEILAAQQRAEHANQAKSEFLANMSHEIRTPLTGILGFTEVLLNDQTIEADAKNEHLYTIQESGRHLLSLINDVLDLSKIEAGQLAVERMACNPHQEISQVVSVMRVKALEKNLAFDYRWGTDVPVVIDSDPGRLRQLVLNLVSNAIKFTANGGVFILVKYETASPPKNARLTIDVVDTGVGIPEEKIESVFEPFVQADNTVTRQYGGTGLGLAISRKLARMLGGDLTLSSTVGRGSTFQLDIDAGFAANVQMVQAEVADALIKKDRSQTGSSASQQEIASVKSARVLIVEDGEVNRRFLTHVLSQAGATVETAENGKIGVDMALSGDFDVIYMDMQMPVMDGYTAATTLRSAGYARPIIALTAHAMVGDRDKCEAAGCSGYLSKPIDSQDLLNSLAANVGDVSGTAAYDSAVCDSAVAGTAGLSIPKAEGVVAVENSVSNMTDQPLYSHLPCGDDLEFQGIVEDFQQHLNHKLDLMEAALHAKNDDDLAELAHWVKGAGGTAGFQDFTQVASDLEHASRRGNRSESERRIASLKTLARRIVLPWRNSPSASSTDVADQSV